MTGISEGTTMATAGKTRPAATERLWSLRKDSMTMAAELTRYRSGRWELRFLDHGTVCARNRYDLLTPALTLSDLVCRDLLADGWLDEA